MKTNPPTWGPVSTDETSSPGSTVVASAAIASTDTIRSTLVLVPIAWKPVSPLLNVCSLSSS